VVRDVTQSQKGDVTHPEKLNSRPRKVKTKTTVPVPTGRRLPIGPSSGKPMITLGVGKEAAVYGYEDAAIKIFHRHAPINTLQSDAQVGPARAERDSKPITSPARGAPPGC
jgi:hypothetical protein